MESFHVIACDMSLTGAAYLSARPDVPLFLNRVSTKPASDVAGRLARYLQITTPIVEIARAHEPTVVLIEGYSFGSKGSAVYDLGELGGVLRWRLREHATRIVEVPPAALKRWVLGKGVGSKIEMTSAVSRWCDRPFQNDDEVDAYALGMLGLALIGQRAPRNEAQRQVVAKLREKLEAAA